MTPTWLAMMQARSHRIEVVKISPPCPGPPSRAEAGTKQSSTKTSAMGEVRRPSLSNGLPTSRPGVPASTRNALMPNGPMPSPSRAKTMSRSATGALVMKVLRPDRTYPPSTLRAIVVRMANASEPASGSVMVWQPMYRPSHSPASHRSCCSGVPNVQIGISLVHMWALMEKTSPLSR